MGYTKGNEWERQGNKIKVFGRGIICECPSPQNGGVVEFVFNARLIVVAPKLYEALKAITAEPNLGLPGRLFVKAFEAIAEVESI